MNFIELEVIANPEISEIILAELSQLPFDTFEETDSGIKAYTEEGSFDIAAVEEIINRYQALGDIQYSTKSIEKVNWNEEWEKNFSPIKVHDQIHVRATFHDRDDSFPYEIIIEPKMSFGTGHHDTTHQILQAQLEIDHKDKIVLDAGTGTGILAIMAKKLGASKVYANDIDQWCVDNSHENYSLNNCQDIVTELGTVEIFDNLKVDVLLANINKNVLLSEMSMYSVLLNSGGIIVFSGFYEDDVKYITAAAAENDITIQRHTVQNKWAAAVGIKS